MVLLNTTSTTTTSQRLNWWFNNTSTTTTYSEDSVVVSRSLNNQVTKFLEEWKLYFEIDWGVFVIIKYMFCGGRGMNICFCTWRGDIILLMKYLNYYCDMCDLLAVRREKLKNYMEAVHRDGDFNVTSVQEAAWRFNHCNITLWEWGDGYLFLYLEGDIILIWLLWCFAFCNTNVLGWEIG